MKEQIYDKSYANTSLTIETDIWTNKDIKGIQKMMMQLYRQMSKDGQAPIVNMTIRQSQILATSVKDITWNQEQLVNRGYIQVYSDVVSGTMIQYLYTKTQRPSSEPGTSSSLF